METEATEPKKARRPKRVGNLIKSVVEGIPVLPGERNYLWDFRLRGFGVMVMPTGVRSYIIQYKIGGRGAPTRRVTIGHHGSPWTADGARKHAQDLLESVRKGIDPFEAAKTELSSRAEHEKTREQLGFSRYADVFLDKWADKRGMKAAPNIRYVFERDLKPFFKDKPIFEISSDEIQELFEAIGERSHSSANLAFAWLRKFFNYSVLKKRKHLPASPMTLMPMPFDNGERDRWLKGAEIRYVWEAADRVSEPAYGQVVRLLLLNGLRLREASDADWSELNFDERTWIIPAERMKNNKPHLVPLSPDTAEIFAAAALSNPERKGPIFRTLRGKRLTNFPRYKQELNHAISEVVAEEMKRLGKPSDPERPLTIEHFVHHDLRRTLASNCQKLGVKIIHTEAILSHTAGERKGITKVYHLYEYQREKTVALRKWAKRIREIVEDRDNCDAPLVPFIPAKRDRRKKPRKAAA